MKTTSRDQGSGTGDQRPRARKRFGQHFLEKAWVDKLIASLGARPEDTFLEIGPGRGALTRPLVRTYITPERVRQQVRKTLIHEVGHYFGMSEEEIEEIEERYWRGETLGPEEDDDE